MNLVSTRLRGLHIVELELVGDERGFFARTFCSNEFAMMGLKTTFVQCNISFNLKRGTLRGMHFQTVPHEEAKLVRCTRGAIYDVVIDIRPESTTFKQWFGITLSADQPKLLYIPEGFAHGFLTLDDNTEVSYQMSEYYYPEYARGIRYNDPTIGIVWPEMLITNISKRDLSYNDFNK
jgi:dTDP-4-dehydrorhamnose 3,5-epimerase